MALARRRQDWQSRCQFGNGWCKPSAVHVAAAGDRRGLAGFHLGDVDVTAENDGPARRRRQRESGMFESFGHRVQEAGLWAVPIFGIGAFGLAIIIERLVVLFFRTRLNKDALLAGLRERIFRGDVMGGIRFLSDQPQSPLTRILKAGLLEVRHGEEEVQAAMDEAAMHELPYLEKRTGYLSMISNAATLVGLIGTVNGMINVFKAVANVSAADKSAALSLGIGEAMNCTFFGLAVAVPMLIAFSLLQGRTQALNDDINSAVASTVNLVMRNKDKLNVAAIEDGNG
ncbi:MAG: MotA/TolQ/ExbB proton channel family protein [Deltaproteobacteria bacterium]|nr:MotA/TolQ/ExbB proton channel family protein [Deltaproteobacteria bacterium]